METNLPTKLDVFMQNINKISSENLTGKILLTTPESPKQKGGIGTFCSNIMKVLTKLDVPFEIIHYKSLKDLLHQRKKINTYQRIIHIHFLGNLVTHYLKNKNILTFVHGSEILMTSPNFLIRILKKNFRKFFISHLTSNKLVVFISHFTQKKCYETGLKANYSRDLVIQNAIDTNESQNLQKDYSDQEITFCAIARDVPHKNLQGTVTFCEIFQSITKKKVILYLGNTNKYKSLKIQIKSFGPSDLERSEVYKKSHFNLIFSLDHSKKGFYEGFGLVVLEAGCFSTPSIGLALAGLNESIHHKKTGFLLSAITQEEILNTHNFMLDNYDKLSKDVFTHTINNHSLDIYKRLFETFII